MIHFIVDFLLTSFYFYFLIFLKFFVTIENFKLRKKHQPDTKQDKRLH